MRLCNASMRSLAFPSLARNSAMHTTWVVSLLAMLAPGKNSTVQVALKRLVKIEGLLRRLLIVHDSANRLNHRNRSFALKYVASHVHSHRTLVNCVVGHCERVQLWQLLASGNQKRNRAACDHARKMLFAVIGFYEVRAHF